MYGLRKQTSFTLSDKSFWRCSDMILLPPLSPFSTQPPEHTLASELVTSMSQPELPPLPEHPPPSSSTTAQAPPSQEERGKEKGKRKSRFKMFGASRK